LEQENFDVIPGKVYVRGFLRNYARFLGLDGEELVNQYNSFALSIDESENTDRRNLQESAVKKTVQRRYTLAAALGLLLVAGIVALFTGIVGGSNAPEDKLARKTENHEEYFSPSKGPVEHENVASMLPDSGNKNSVRSEGITVVLSFSGRCWMLVKVDKNKVFEGFAYAGEKKEFSGQESVTVRLGNAGVAKVKVNGVEKGYLGEKGDVEEKTFWAEKKADT